MPDKNNRLKSLDELRRIRAEAQRENELRTTGENPDRIVLAVGMATCGIAAGARQTAAALRDAITENHLTNVSIVSTGCFGLCYAEPMVEVRMPDQPPIRYGNVDAALARDIIQTHVMRGELIDKAIVGREVRNP